MKTVSVELINNNAFRLLKDLELANILRIVSKQEPTNKLSAKLRGSISKIRARQLNEQLLKMRNEWQKRSI